jgi:RimJ/RimL family protein N-acetyltransferase
MSADLPNVGSLPGPVGEPVDPTPARAPSAAPMRGDVVALVPVEPDAHVPALFGATHGSAEAEAVWTYMGYGPFGDEPTMRAWLGSLVDSADPRFFTVLDLASGAPLGVVSYLNVDTAMRHVELGHIWYVPTVQRTKVNTETVYLLLRRAFDELGNRRVEWKCDALNARSRAAALRLGFTFEGVFRQHMIVKGRNRDTAWYAMLDGEWPSRRADLERWLAAESGTFSLSALHPPS